MSAIGPKIAGKEIGEGGQKRMEGGQGKQTYPSCDHSNNKENRGAYSNRTRGDRGGNSMQVRKMAFPLFREREGNE